MKYDSSGRSHSGLAQPRFILTGLLITVVLTLSVVGRSTPASNAQHSQAPAPKNQGKFKIRYEPRKSLRRKNTGCKLGTDRSGVQDIVDSLNNTVSLPFDIYLIFNDCGESDVYYDYETRQIMVCYEWMDNCGSLYSRRIKSRPKCNEDVKGAFAFALFHEMAHAIIDSCKLPITGKEEDAADQFASLLLIEKLEGGGNLALGAALGFKFYAHLERHEKKIYWDEHSLDEQRYYEIVCMVYGHDSEKYSYLTKKGTLPWERAEMCVDDYPKIKNAWQTLLAPHARKQDEKEAPQRDSYGSQILPGS